MLTNDNLSSAEVATLVAERAEALGGKRAAAETWGVSLQMVYLVIRGERPPAKAMLDDLGIVQNERVVSYRRVQK
jgi:hypothetical protein